MPSYESLSSQLTRRILQERQDRTFRKVGFDDGNVLRRRALPQDHASIWRPAFVHDIDKIMHCPYYNLSDTQYKFGTPQTLLMVRKSELSTFFEKNCLTDDISTFHTTYNNTFNRYEFNNIARLIIHCENERQEWIEENKASYGNDVEKTAAIYESINSDWNKVVLVPVTTIKDSNNNIVNFRHDLNLNSARLVGGKDKIEIKVICSAFNQ